MSNKANTQRSGKGLGKGVKKLLIGRTEWCALPSLGIPLIKARIDTGAKTSALYAQKIQSFEKDGQQWVSFEVHPIQKSRQALIRCEAQVNDYRAIKSSTGTSHERYVIETDLELGDRTHRVEITLTNRKAMSHRMLIGRQALNKRAIVDPAKSCTQGRHKKSAVFKAYGL